MGKKKYLILFFILCSLPPLLHAQAPFKKKSGSEQDRPTLYLKKYMSDFGQLLAGMEVLGIKGKSPEWEAINTTLRDMEDTLYRMRMADQEDNYKEFTDILGQNLKEVQEYGRKRDKKIYQAFKKMSHTCFQCHAQHRPSNAPVPKKNPIGSDRVSRLLFSPDIFHP